jgi:hypothetical protein
MEAGAIIALPEQVLRRISFLDQVPAFGRIDFRPFVEPRILDP